MSNQRTKHASQSTRGTMSWDGSSKAKTVFGQSSKILFKQKWGIPKVYSFSPFLAGPNLPLESAQNIAKIKTFQKSTSSGISTS